MIFNLTEQEQTELQVLEDSYAGLIRKSERKIEELRPDDPEPDHEEYRRLQESRPILPPMPEPIETSDGETTYKKGDLDAYLSSPEYLEYVEENKRISEAIERLYDEWYAAGSDEWKAERERKTRLERKLFEARKDFLRKAEDRYFSTFNGDPEKILEDAYTQVDKIIYSTYQYYDQLRRKGSFRARDVRLLEDGNMRLDSQKTKENIVAALERHFKELPENMANELWDYIKRAIETNPLVGSSGELWAEVPYIETTEENSALIGRPLSKRSVITTRLMHIAFDGKRTLERDYEKDLHDKRNRYNVGLYEKDCSYNLKVAIDYRSIENNEIVKLPPLTREARHIYNAIVSFWLEGNFAPTYRQIWRATCGNMRRSIKYGEDERRQIEIALLSFKASIAYSTGEIVELRKAKGEPPKIIEEGGTLQILHYDTTYRKVNGQLTDVLLLDPNRRPTLLAIAQALNNQYMTDNIGFFDVKGLSSTIENLDLKEYLFVRIKQMKNHNNKIKSRKISIDTLVKDLEIEPFDKKISKDRTRKSRLINRITLILENAVLENFIKGYEPNKRKGTKEVISFTIIL